jgi:hypothetical protein
VKDHIFTNSSDGTGFHSIARSASTLRQYVRRTAGDHNAAPYTAEHLANDRTTVVATGKSMFPDNWDDKRVVDVIERALTRNDLPLAERRRINASGVTEEENRRLPAPVGGRVRGRADGVVVEGIMQAGALATVYPIVR